MTHTISVVPAERGWLVSSTAFDNPMAFLSGARAEAAARRLGEKLAREGQRSEIRIHLRDGTLAGRFVCAPDQEDLALAG